MEKVTIRDLIINLRHVGIIAKDAEYSTDLFKRLFDVEDREISVLPASATGGSSVYSFVSVGGTALEFIEPISEEFKNLLSNPVLGFNHIAFTVRALRTAVELMRKKGVRLGHVKKEGILDTGRSIVAYFNPEDTGGILVEFVEPREEQNV